MPRINKQDIKLKGFLYNKGNDKQGRGNLPNGKKKNLPAIPYMGNNIWTIERILNFQTSQNKTIKTWAIDINRYFSEGSTNG